MCSRVFTGPLPASRMWSPSAGPDSGASSPARNAGSGSRELGRLLDDWMILRSDPRGACPSPLKGPNTRCRGFAASRWRWDPEALGDNDGCGAARTRAERSALVRPCPTASPKRWRAGAAPTGAGPTGPPQAHGRVGGVWCWPGAGWRQRARRPVEHRPAVASRARTRRGAVAPSVDGPGPGGGPAHRWR